MMGHVEALAFAEKYAQKNGLEGAYEMDDDFFRKLLYIYQSGFVDGLKKALEVIQGDE